MTTFEITKVPCRIESLAFAKSKPKSDNEMGTGMKKLVVWIDITSAEAFANVVPLMPGLLRENTLQAVAAEEGPGFDVKGKRKLGTCLVKLHTGDGEDILIESPTARVGLPRVQVGKDAETAWLILQVEMAVPRDALGSVDDYFKADTFVSVANAQLDLEEEAKAKVKAKVKSITAEPGQVEWVPRTVAAE